MFRYAWSELITPGLLARLTALAASDSELSQADIGDSLVSVFRHTGGLPISEAELDEAGRTRLALQLISDAVDRYVALQDPRVPETGFYLRDSARGDFSREIVSVRKLDANTAGVDELAALPVLGKALARRMIAERKHAGPFVSFEDLSRRVNGIGPEAGKVLGEALVFGPAAPDVLEWDPRADFDRRFKACLALFAKSKPADNVARMLDRIATTVAAAPHPASTDRQPRFDLDVLATATGQVDWVGVLASGDYYRQLPGLMKSAAASIKVAMFHAAFVSGNHPTRALLDELVAAHERGVAVKVLLDRDRESDPYLSTVINTAAKAYLEAEGVPCRFDREDVLMHSKFLVLDEKVCVIGSHNWSAGSYFRFDDLSMVIASAELGAQLAARFEQMWPDPP